MRHLTRTIIVACIVIFVCSGFLAGCANAPVTTTPSPASITDQSGKTITFKDPPQRIVSLAPSNTEILFALGLGDRIVGVTDSCNYPPEAKQKPSIGGFSTTNIEEVIAKSPDLVLAANLHKTKIVPQLEAKGLNVLVLDPKTIDEVIAAITLVGQITGKDKEAQALTSSMRQRVKIVTDKTAGLPQEKRPATAFIVWHDPLMIAGSGTFHDELITKSGGINIGRALTGYSRDFNLENLLVSNPEVIIAGVGMGDGEDKPLQFMLSESRLKDVSARKNNRVYAINQDIAGRYGPRIADALEQFAKFIHPELFK